MPKQYYKKIIPLLLYLPLHPKSVYSYYLKINITCQLQHRRVSTKENIEEYEYNLFKRQIFIDYVLYRFCIQKSDTNVTLNMNKVNIHEGHNLNQIKCLVVLTKKKSYRYFNKHRGQLIVKACILRSKELCNSTLQKNDTNYPSSGI